MRRRTGQGGGLEGYTLMEVLAVVCVIGLLSSLFAPDWSAMVSRMRVRGATARVVSDLAYARTSAAMTGHSTVLALEPSSACPVRFRGRVAGHRYHVASAAAPDVPLRTVDLRRDGGRVCLEMNNSATVRFDSRGLPHRFNNRTLWLHEGAAADSLALSVLGRVRRR